MSKTGMIGQDTQDVLTQYTEGLISAIEFRSKLREIAGYEALVRSAPSEKTRLKHQAAYLRREMRKIHALQQQRAKVKALEQQLDNLQFEEQTRCSLGGQR